jgi:hypothetical protein
MEVINSGNSIVDEVGQMNFTGNIVPKRWFDVIKFANGKPNLVAINLLADIVFWYRPTEVRNEDGGSVVYKKRFAADDFLQKSYKQISAELGVTHCQAKNAVVFLEKELGVIKRHFRNIDAGKGVVLQNVMYIELIPVVLRRITFHSGNKDSVNGRNMDLETHTPVFENTHPCIPEDTSPYTEVHNTYISSYISDREYTNPINRFSGYSEAEEVFKEQIDYDSIREDRPNDARLLDSIVDVVTEILTSHQKEIRIAKDIKSIELVKNRFSKLNMYTVIYVMDCLSKEAIRIRNPKQYLLASLFNAPGTEDIYYQNQVNHDMYGGDS